MCRRSERARFGFRHCLVLLAKSAAHADRSHNLVAALRRNAAGDDHDAPVIRSVNPEELSALLTVLSPIFGRDIECPGRPRLFDRDVHAANPRPIHPRVGYQVASQFITGILVALLISSAFRSAAAIPAARPPA